MRGDASDILPYIPTRIYIRLEEGGCDVTFCKALSGFGDLATGTTAILLGDAFEYCAMLLGDAFEYCRSDVGTPSSV